MTTSTKRKKCTVAPEPPPMCWLYDWHNGLWAWHIDSDSILLSPENGTLSWRGRSRSCYLSSLQPPGKITSEEAHQKRLITNYYFLNKNRCKCYPMVWEPDDWTTVTINPLTDPTVEFQTRPGRYNKWKIGDCPLTIDYDPHHDKDSSVAISSTTNILLPEEVPRLIGWV